MAIRTACEKTAFLSKKRQTDEGPYLEIFFPDRFFQTNFFQINFSEHIGQEAVCRILSIEEKLAGTPAGGTVTEILGFVICVILRAGMKMSRRNRGKTGKENWIMRKIRIPASLLLALAMALRLLTAFAADRPYAITIDHQAEGYSYAAYQIFAGTLCETTEEGITTKILSDILWGDGVTAEGQAALLSKFSAADAADLAEKLSDGSVSAEAFAAEAGKYLAEAAGTADTCTEGRYTITDLEAGYYLIKNTQVPDMSGAYTSYMLQVVSDVRIKPKESIPVSDKKVDDCNDSDGVRENLGTCADYDIGDQVPFTLTAALQSDYADYDTYILNFHDVMAEGLTFIPESVVITVTEEERVYTAQSGYRVVTASKDKPIEDGCTFEVKIEDLNKLKTADGTVIPVNAYSQITVQYEAVLGENAVIGNPGNLNTMHTEYSDNPYSSGETNRTPDHAAAVFTYRLVVSKTDENEQPLSGAAFALYKYMEEAGGYVDVSSRLTVSGGGTVFTFNGLDDGRYRIAETAAPEGYNSIDDLYFEVTAEHGADPSSDTGYSTKLKVTPTDAKGRPNTEAEQIFSVSGENRGEIHTTVINRNGSILPGTGGRGRAVFYIPGVFLVIAAAALLIRRRRMSRMQ